MRIHFSPSTLCYVNLSLTPFGLADHTRTGNLRRLVSPALGGYLYLSGEEGREPLMLPGTRRSASLR